MEVGKRISELRQRKGYTINKLANKAGVSQSYLRDVELSDKNPTVSFISLLCDVLEISLAEFFSTESNTETDSLISTINQLNQEQRTALDIFLKSMNK